MPHLVNSTPKQIIQMKMEANKEKKAKRKKQNINGKDYVVLNCKVKPYLDKNGKRKEYKKFYGATLKECKEKRDRFNEDHGLKAKDMFFGELVEDFIKNTFLPDPRYKDRTKQRYIDAYNKNLAPMGITKMLITDIDYRRLQKAYNEMTCAPSTIEAIHKLLQHFFKLMEQEGICKDHTKSLVVPKDEMQVQTKEVIVFNEDELTRMKTYLSSSGLNGFERRRVRRLKFLITLAINTGARIGELLALTYDDIHKDKIFINKQVIAKPIFKDGKTDHYELSIADTKTTNSIRSIPISEETYNEFLEHQKWHKKELLKNGYRTNQVFTTDTGNLYDTRSLRHTLDKIHAAAEVPQYGFHVYRHTFGSMLAAKGVALQTLSALMGHADISVTAKYYINIPEAEKIDAIQMLG